MKIFLRVHTRGCDGVCECVLAHACVCESDWRAGRRQANLRVKAESGGLSGWPTHVPELRTIQGRTCPLAESGSVE